jgi:hypothetical protein
VTFRERVAAFVLGRLRTEDLAGAALQALEEGREAADLGALAGAPENASPSELLDLWHRVLRQLAVGLPSRGEAGCIVRDQIARRVAAGSLLPREGAASIADLARELQDVRPNRRYVGDGLGVAKLVGLYHSHDDVAFGDERAHREIDDDIRAECARIAGGKQSD